MMHDYVFRAVHREPDGMLGLTLHEQVVEPADDIAAVARAKLIELVLSAHGANAVYVSAEDGRAI